MIPASWWSWTPMRIAAGTLLLSTGAALFTFGRAVQLTEPPVAARPVLPNPGALAAPPRAVAIDVREVVRRDLFDVMRAAPANRYRLPSDRVETGEAPAAPQTPPRVGLLGIALADSGRSFATVQLENANPVIVRAGDKLGPYTVKLIERKQVTLSLPPGFTNTLVVLNYRSGT